MNSSTLRRQNKFLIIGSVAAVAVLLPFALNEYQMHVAIVSI
ncbi:MAG: hypothetical protein N3H84_07175 [Candidatus Caldarchaeum sp.]|nr:hypothetical protein [Candidatus Caldarchaeum sp.]